MDGLYTVGEFFFQDKYQSYDKMICCIVIYMLILRFIIYVTIISCTFMGIFLYMLHIGGYCYFSINSYITKCNDFFMCICKSSTRVLHVCV
jgi:hypothetical protein